MKAPFEGLCERRDIWDLVQLLGGHFWRYRPYRLHDVVTAHCVRPRASSASIFWIVNGSIRLRRWIRKHTYLRWRYVGSRIRWKLAPNEQQRIRASACVTTFSLLCPSRNRVDNVRRLIESVYRTAAYPQQVELLCYVDADDPSLARYRRLFAETPRRFSRMKRCVLIVGEPTTVGRAWNVLARAAQGDVLKLVNDDMVFVDYGWDERAATALMQYPDGMVCLFFDAGQYRETVLDGDFPMVSRRWFETLGYFTPEMFEFGNHEMWIMDIAKRAGRLRPIDGILLDHLHYSNYLAPFDETYRRHRLITVDKIRRDMILFHLTARLREAEADRLRQIIDPDHADRSARSSMRPAIA